MRKLALIFLLFVLAPSLGLGWLAVRSLSNQQLVFERQQTLLYQRVCDGLVRDIADFMAERQTEFGQRVENLLGQREPAELARRFDELIVPAWPLAEVGVAVSLDGRILSPSLTGRPQARAFRVDNERFLCSQESVEVYWKSPKGDIPLSIFDEKPSDTDSSTEARSQPSKGGEKPRAVVPLKEAANDGKTGSRISAEEAEFKHLIGAGTEGILARFLQNRLKLLMWYRSSRDPRIVYGAQLRLSRLEEALRPLIRPSAGLPPDICVALLDDNGRPITRSHAQFSADWKRPFVSAEIGEFLPHWEVAAYLLNPNKLTESARTLAFTLGLLICFLLLAIGVGGGLIAADLRRQLLSARQKTDFVSNVSHELKTPLTSIRMFSELLAEGRVSDPVKQQTYLTVIATEAARLTRLINNVLDFARSERGEKKYHRQREDLIALAREVVETCRPHLEGAGFRLDCFWPDTPVYVLADRDALAQVIVNLISNAEKYSGPVKEIQLELSVAEPAASGVSYGCLRVLDRGLGVPPGAEEKIFEQFYRAHDSLSSGITGTGLGLTLARRIARAHDGDVEFCRREGGGSCFILRVPLA